MMLKKALILLLLTQGLLMASEEKLDGIDTLHTMSVELESQSDIYLNKMYQNSVVNTEVMLDLYWANQCKSDVEALETFASNKIKSDEYYHFISLHIGSGENLQTTYKDEITDIHTKNCDTTYVSLAQ